MDNKIITFPAARVARAAANLPRQAARVVSLESWRSADRPLRTANGVFFISSVLTTPGDFA